MKAFLGALLVKAEKSVKEDQMGYMIEYPDGRISWSPADEFEASYFPLEQEDKLSEVDIQRFIDAGQVSTQKMGDKTLLVLHVLPTGWEDVESSSCVEAVNYDEEIGKACVREHMENKLWKFLGFMLQWARHGLKK